MSETLVTADPVAVNWLQFSVDHWDDIDFVKVNGVLRQVHDVDVECLDNPCFEPELPVFKYTVDHGQVIQFKSGRLVGAVLLDEFTARLADGTTLSFFAEEESAVPIEEKLVALKF